MVDTIQLSDALLTKKTVISTTLGYLATDTSFYVATTGNDTTGDGTSGNPWATLQGAYDAVSQNINLAGKRLTINVADGTYAGFVAGAAPLGSGTIFIVGNTTTPANVVINTPIIVGIGQFSVSGVTVTGVTGSCIQASGPSLVYVDSACVLGTATVAHFLGTGQGRIRVRQNYTVTGDAPNHIWATQQGSVTINPVTATFSGSRAFTRIAYASELGTVYAAGATLSGGTVTGQRYNAVTNGVINTGGGGANFFTGNSAGATATGGQYV